jgi:uncharacterized protein YprB with RNaseH-like and TPR domain
MTEKLVLKARSLLADYPQFGRQALSEALGITDYKARELLRYIKNEPIEVFGPTIAVFDLETTDLSADFGRLLCGSILTYPSMEMRTFRYDDYANDPHDDRELAIAIRDHLSGHHITVGYYSKGFDIPFLNTRLLVHGEQRMPQMLHIDPIWFYRGWRGMKVRSSKMKVIAKVLNLDEQKMDVPDETWINARHGDKEAMDVICERCESDVRVTMKILCHCLDNRLMKSIQTYP